MSEEMTPMPQFDEPKKKSNAAMIITIVVLVVLCCCCLVAAGIWYLWTYGDQIFQLTLSQLPLLL
jgi:flagellar basal body-associated protein FliL